MKLMSVHHRGHRGHRGHGEDEFFTAKAAIPRGGFDEATVQMEKTSQHAKIAKVLRRIKL
jgi:hypothetical protein